MYISYTIHNSNYFRWKCFISTEIPNLYLCFVKSAHEILWLLNSDAYSSGNSNSLENFVKNFSTGRNLIALRVN